MFFDRNATVAHGHREDTANGGFQGAAIIVSHPSSEFQEGRTDHGFLIQKLADISHGIIFTGREDINNSAGEQSGAHRYSDLDPTPIEDVIDSGIR